jgi:hypothetical protein
MIFPISDIPGVGTQKMWIYRGYFIALPFDIRFIRDDPKTKFISCRVYSPSELLLQIPAWPYPFTSNDDRNCWLARVDPSISNGIDECRNAFAQNFSARQWKYIILRFPEDHTLTTQPIFEDAGVDEWCKLELVPIFYETVKGAIPPQYNVCHYAGFQVVRSDIPGRKRGSVEHQNSESDAAKLIASMNGGWGT